MVMMIIMVMIIMMIMMVATITMIIMTAINRVCWYHLALMVALQAHPHRTTGELLIINHTLDIFILAFLRLVKDLFINVHTDVNKNNNTRINMQTIRTTAFAIGKLPGSHSG